MNKQNLRECIFDGLETMNDIPIGERMAMDNVFVASFLAGWITASIRYETVEIPELHKK